MLENRRFAQEIEGSQVRVAAAEAAAAAAQGQLAASAAASAQAQSDMESMSEAAMNEITIMEQRLTAEKARSAQAQAGVAAQLQAQVAANQAGGAQMQVLQGQIASLTQGSAQAQQQVAAAGEERGRLSAQVARMEALVQQVRCPSLRASLPRHRGVQCMCKEKSRNRWLPFCVRSFG